MYSGRFARQQRLLSSSDYQYVFAQPSRFSDRHLTLFVRSNARTYARLGLAIPKRQIKRAVQRNRLKRVIRESFRTWQSKLVGLDIIVMARSGAERLTNLELRNALDKHWHKISLTCAESSSC